LNVYGRAGFAGMKCLVQVRRERIIGDVTTTTTHHFIASVETRQASRMAEIVRSHWGVENKLHWRLDVALNEDQSRLRKGHAAENMSRLRRLGLNLLQRDTSKKMGIKNKRLAAGWSHDYLIQLLASG